MPRPLERAAVGHPPKTSSHGSLEFPATETGKASEPKLWSFHIGGNTCLPLEMYHGKSGDAMGRTESDRRFRPSEQIRIHAFAITKSSPMETWIKQRHEGSNLEAARCLYETIEVSPVLVQRPEIHRIHSRLSRRHSLVFWPDHVFHCCRRFQVWRGRWLCQDIAEYSQPLSRTWYVRSPQVQIGSS